MFHFPKAIHPSQCFFNQLYQSKLSSLTHPHMGFPFSSPPCQASSFRKSTWWPIPKPASSSGKEAVETSKTESLFSTCEGVQDLKMDHSNDSSFFDSMFGHKITIYMLKRHLCSMTCPPSHAFAGTWPVQTCPLERCDIRTERRAVETARFSGQTCARTSLARRFHSK